MRRILSIMLVVCFFLSNSAVPALAETIQQEREWNKILNVFSEGEKNSLDKAMNDTNKSGTVENPEDAYTKDGGYVTDRFIIKYKEDSRTLGRVKSEGKHVRSETAGFKHRTSSVEFFEDEELMVISTTEEMTADELLESVEGQAVENDILYIQPDYEMTMASTDPLTNGQWGHGQGVGADVITAWEVTKGKGVVVALFDSGIETTHEGLSGNLLPGWDFVNEDDTVNDYEWRFDQGHGTMMAGIIAAKEGNSKGIAGVAPEAKVMPLKVFQGGAAYTSDIIRAINYAEENGARVANMSFGSSFFNPALLEAIENSEMLFVCAAGNSGYNIDKYPVYPASFELDNVIAVASTDNDGRLSMFSNYGAGRTDVVAPGSGIMTTWLEGTYHEAGGTSVAAAYVTGEAALLFSLGKYNSAAEVKERVISSSDRITGLTDKVRNGKKINCMYAVSNNKTTNANVITVDDGPREDLEPGIMPDREDFELYADGYVSMRRSMNTARHGLAVVAVKGKIYAIGGQTTSTAGFSRIVEEYNPQTDSWTTMPNLMPVGKSYFGYFVYNDKVYIIGGATGANAYSRSVEIYDPANDSWDPKGDLMLSGSESRGLTATLDPTSGKAYIIGGYNSGGYRNTVYELDPGTNTPVIIQKPSIKTSRSNHVAFYYNGNIYVESGLGNGGVRLYTEEQYIIKSGETVNGGAPRTFMVDAAGVAIEDRFIGIGGKNEWTSALFTTTMTHSNLQQENTSTTASYITKSQMNVARAGLGATLLNGKVYMAGGINGNSVLAYLEELDLGWQGKAPLPIPLRDFKSIEAGGKIYVLGGTTLVSGATPRSKAIYEYDPISDSWTQKADLPYYCDYFSVAEAYGKIYLISGCAAAAPIGASTPTNKVYEYNPNVDTWVEKASIGRSRENASATLYNGKIYVLGGSSGNRFVDVYDPLSDKWTSKNDLPQPRRSPYSNILQGNLFVVTAYDSSVLIYNEINDSWQTKTPVTNYYGNIHFTLQDTIFSLNTFYSSITPSIYEYFLAENTWAYYMTFNFIGNLNEAVTLNNKAYIFTGADGYSTGLVEYSVSKSPWVVRSSLNEPVSAMGATTVNGKIYIAGGYSYLDGYFDDVWEYDPDKDQWTEKSGLLGLRGNHGLVAVNGKLYVVGGENAENRALNTVEEYDPTNDTGKWVPRASLDVPLTDVAVVESGGKIYAIGGKNRSGVAVNTIYSYDPSVLGAKWEPLRSMDQKYARYGASAGVIDGMIYVAGGFTSVNNDIIPPWPSGAISTMVVYNINENEWITTKAALPYSFGYAGGAAGDTFYVIGGYDGYNEFSMTYEYSPILDKWFSWPGPNGKNYSFGTVLTAEGLYAIGGSSTLAYTSGVEYAPISMLTSDFIHFGDEQINPSGNFARTYTDMEYAAPGFNMVFSRTYNSGDDRASNISKGWTFGFESKLTESGNNLVARLPNGSGITFGINAATGTYTAKDSRSTLVKNADNTKVLTTADQYSYGYNSAGHMTWMKDRNGNTINITVNANGQVTEVKDPAGRASTVTYASNRISQITDPAGRKVSYAYDSSGRLITVTGPNGFTSGYEYDSNGFLNKIKDASNLAVETITYYPKNIDESIPKVNTIADAYGKTDTYVYDKIEGRVTITDNNGRVTKKWFDKTLYPTREIDAEGKETRTAYFDEGGINKYGEVKSFTDRNGNTVRFDRDGRGNITRQLNTDGSIREFTYDDKNNITSEKDEEGKMIFYAYDAEGINLIKTARPLNGTDVYSTSAPQTNFAITENTYYTETEAQDMCGKAIHGLLKNVKDPNGGITSFTYDVNGYMDSVEDALSQVTEYKSNIIGWLIQEKSIEGYITKYYYDKEGCIIKKTLHGGETERDVYDNRGNITCKVSPNQYTAASDPTVYDANNISTNANAYNAAHGYSYTYLPNGLLQKAVNPLGHETSYTYDIYGNLLTETLHNGLININTYDIMNRPASTSFKEDSTQAAKLTDEYSYGIRPTGETEVIYKRYLSDTATAVTKETYDYAGRLIRVDNPDGGYSLNEYAPNGNLIKSTDPRGNSAYYAYDGLNRLKGLWSPAGGGAYMYTGYEYDKAGSVIKETRGKDTTSALSVPAGAIMWNAWAYDALGRVIETTDSTGGCVTHTYSDPTNTVIQRVYRSATEYNQTTKKYNYFGKVRESIIHVDPLDFVSGASELVETYAFDKEGNITSRTNPDNITATYTYDLLSRMLTSSEPGIDENGAVAVISTEFTYDFMGNVLTEKDPLNRVTSCEYDKRGQLIRKTDAAGGISYFCYDHSGRLTDEVSPANYAAGSGIGEISRKTYEYDNMNRVTAQKDIYRDASGTFRTITNSYTYDLNGNQLTSTDGLGYVTSYSYDAANRVVSTLDPETAYRGGSFTKQFTYDGAGRLLSERDANNVITSYTYNDRGDVTSVSVGGVIAGSMSYDLAGNVITESDGNGNTTIYSYNNINGVRQTEFPSDGTIGAYTVSNKYTKLGAVARSETSMWKVNTFTYDNQGRLLSGMEMKNNVTEVITKSYRYDVCGNLRFTVDGRGNTTEYTYDSLNRMIKESVSVTAGGQSSLRTSVKVYDLNGNVTEVADWLGNKYVNTYDRLNRVTEKKDPSGNIIEKLVYNDNHQQIASIDALGNVTSFGYDRAGRPTTTTDPSLNTTSRSYDNAGNLISQTDGRDNVTKYSYDSRGQLIKVTNALDEDTLYSYDNAGNMISQTDGRGNTSVFSYNVRNLLSVRTDPGDITGGVTESGKAEYYTFYPDGSLASKKDRNGIEHTYAYDIHGRLTEDNAGGEIIRYSYNSNGDMLTMADATGTTTRTYDELGRATSKTVPHIGTSTYLYDITVGLSAGLLAESTTDPKGNVTVKTYDKSGRLSQVKDGSTVTATYTYFANGNRQKVEYQGGATEEFTYYANNRLHTLVNKRGTTTIEAYSYEYDAAGNMIAKVDRKDTTKHTYDKLNRLKSVTEPGGKLTSYSFDESGNRSSEIVTENSVVTVTSYTYNEQNRLVATEITVDNQSAEGTNYYYDNNGNMISSVPYSLKDINIAMDGGIGLFLLGLEKDEPAALYEYDNRNNMVMAVSGESTTSSKYNGSGLRVEKTVNGKTCRSLYEYDKIILEVDVSGSQTARNIYGLNLLKREADSSAFMYMYNGHGDVTALLNQSGTVAVQYYYDAFGVLTEETARVNNPFRYSGYEYDEESGLYYLKSRHYDPAIARFMQEDTDRGSARDPLSLNLYTYCSNEPVKYYDPSGHAQEFVLVRSDGSYWEPMAGKSGAYVDKKTGNIVSTTPEWTTSGSNGSNTNTGKSSTGSNSSSSSGGSSSGGGLGGVNFGPNEGADWLRTGSGKTFEEFWGVTPYGMAYSTQATNNSMVKPPTVQGIGTNLQQIENNINSATNAYQGGYISFSQYYDNVALNLSDLGLSGEALYYVAALLTGSYKDTNQIIPPDNATQHIATQTASSAFSNWAYMGYGPISAQSAPDSTGVYERAGDTVGRDDVTLIEVFKGTWILASTIIPPAAAASAGAKVGVQTIVVIGSEITAIEAAAKIAPVAIGAGIRVIRLEGGGTANLNNGLGTFESQGGHHPMAKSAFEGIPGYDSQKAITISKDQLESFGVKHSTVTGQQHSLYSAFAATNKPLTMNAMRDIEIQALVNSGVPRDYAVNAVDTAIADLKKLGITAPVAIPWNK